MPIVLNLSPSNYSTWRTLFEVAFSKFGVMDHILDAPRPLDAQWVQNDAFIMSWMYNRVSSEILSLVHQRQPTAVGVWCAIESLFLDNAETQAVFVGSNFRNLEQGDMPIMRYFARLKDYADQLTDLGFPVDDKAQVLNMFRGLNPRFFYAIPIMTMQLRFPTFLRCRAFLILEESRLNMASPASTDMALHADRANPHAAPTAPPSAAPSAPSNNTNACTDNGNRNRNRGKGKAAQQDGAPAGGQTIGRLIQLPAPATNPWTGMVHAWPMPWHLHAPGAGVLGPRPGSPSPFAGHVAHQQPPPPAAPYYNNIWDQSALVQALNNMAPQQKQALLPPPSEWYLDTGASLHMSCSPGMLSDLAPSSSRIVVGDGSTQPVLHSGHLSLPTSSSPIHLRNVLVSPSLIKNLISIKSLCRDNPVTVDFDNLGFSVKDRRTRKVILRCNSSGDLYHVRIPPLHCSLHAHASVSADVWHQHLGHPGCSTLDCVLCSAAPHAHDSPSHTCHACQIGKNVRLPFLDSNHH
jgi:hypothetical protein